MLGDDKVDSNIYQGASNDKNVTVSIYQLNIDTQKSTTAHKNVTFQAGLKLLQLRECGLTLSNSQFLPVSCYQTSRYTQGAAVESAILWENIPSVDLHRYNQTYVGRVAQSV